MMVVLAGKVVVVVRNCCHVRSCTLLCSVRFHLAPGAECAELTPLFFQLIRAVSVSVTVSSKLFGFLALHA